jgi:hypothetical protein
MQRSTKRWCRKRQVQSRYGDIEGQSRKPFEYRLFDFITAYTIDISRSQTPDSKAKAEQAARDPAGRLMARQRLTEAA